MSGVSGVMRFFSLSFLSLTLALAACSKPPAAPSGATPAPVPAPVAAPATPCEACLAEGQMWTAGRCFPTCYQDTYCYKPGDTCPAPGLEPTEEGTPSW